MSLPKHTTSPSLSSSPSRQSIRRTTDSATPSRPQSIIDRPPTAQQTLDPNTTHDSADNPPLVLQGDGHHDFPHLSSQPHSHHLQQQQQPPFQPFFTLIEDTNTSEYYHPTVHYIFSDDDSDIVTEAALRSLESNQDALAPGMTKGKSKPRDQQRDGVVDEDEDGFASPRKDPLLPPPVPGVRDNYIVLDMETASFDELHQQQHQNQHHFNIANAASSTRDDVAGTTTPSAPALQSQQPQTQTQPPIQFTVSSAHSLTPSWQVLDTQVLPAPTFETNTSNEPVNGGLMLKIQGTAGLPMTMLGKDRDKERSSQRLEDMMDQFSKRLGELRQVIEAGEKGHVGQGQGRFRGEEVGGPETTDMPATGEFGTGNNALGLDLQGDGAALEDGTEVGGHE